VQPRRCRAATGPAHPPTVRPQRAVTEKGDPRREAPHPDHTRPRPRPGRSRGSRRTGRRNQPLRRQPPAGQPHPSRRPQRHPQTQHSIRPCGRDRPLPRQSPAAKPHPAGRSQRPSCSRDRRDDPARQPRPGTLLRLARRSDRRRQRARPNPRTRRRRPHAPSTPSPLTSFPRVVPGRASGPAPHARPAGAAFFYRRTAPARRPVSCPRMIRSGRRSRLGGSQAGCFDHSCKPVPAARARVANG
jgi:hypothetical protein